MAPLCRLFDLPDEILTKILSHTTSPSFIQATATCHKLFDLAADSRDVVLQHLHSLPGIKLGLDDLTVRTQDLFLLLRQRASRYLYGAHFTASCIDLTYRNASIDADASCIAELGADYITLSTVLKNSLTVRMYGSKCAQKEKIDSPYCGGVGKILQVVHRKHTISILYQWHRFKSPVPDFAEPLAVKTLSETMADTKGPPEAPITTIEDILLPHRMKYHLQHYNAYTMDRPYFFNIEPYKDLVPVHLTVNSRLHCAILWDRKDHKIEPSDSAEIVLYTAARCPVNEEGTYDARVIWPITHEVRPATPTSQEIITGKAPSRPKRIAFYKDGRRLKLFDAGGVVPYSVISAGTVYDSRAGSNQVAFDNGTLFHVDTPFFGVHETHADAMEERNFCDLSHLCLGVVEVGRSTSKCKILCILRSKARYDHEDCSHTVELTRMAHVSAHNCKAVARLWGWSENFTSLTGLETVSISKFGTRIAISKWDKIYVWALDPTMLCEEVHDADSDDEDLGTQKSRKKRKTKVKGAANDFYTRVRDPYLGWHIAELKPVVLDLKGAVARQMVWSVADDEEVQSESDIENAGGENDSEQDDIELVVQPESEADIVCDEVSNDPDGAVKEEQDTNKISSDSSPHAPEIEAELNLAAVTEVDGVDDDSVSDTKSVKETIEQPQTDKSSGEPDVTHTKRPIDHIALRTTDRQLCGQPPTVEISIEVTNDTAQPEPQPITTPIVPSNPATTAAVIEAPFLDLPNQPPKSPKGKEREIDPEALSASCSVVLPDLANTPESLVDAETIKVKKHRKRHTEDELVIMTDRGIQVWDLGAWGKGKRTRQWLSER